MTYLLRAPWRRTLLALIAIIALFPFTAPHADAAPADRETVTSTVTKKNDDSFVVRIDQGSLAVESDGLAVRDPQGRLIETVPLTLASTDGLMYPITVSAAGQHTATLTLSRDRSAATPAPRSVLDSLARHQAAEQNQKKQKAKTKKQQLAEAEQLRFAETYAGVIAGGMVAAAIGFGLGCVVGGILGFLPGNLLGAFIGCLVGGAVVAPFAIPVGWIVGGIAGGITAQQRYEDRVKQINQQNTPKQQKSGGQAPKSKKAAAQN